MPGRLRSGVACRSSMVRPLPEARGRGGRPRPEGWRLQLAALLQRQQSHDVFARGRLAVVVSVPAVVLETGAVAGGRPAVEVDVVDLAIGLRQLDATLPQVGGERFGR